MPSQPNDALLVQQAIAGDREAFGDLYEMHLDSIYRYLLYRVSDEREAEDLTETVFLKAWEALDRYQPSAIPFTAWLYRIAHNLLIDRHRAHKMTETLEVKKTEKPEMRTPEPIETRKPEATPKPAETKKPDDKKSEEEKKSNSGDD